MTSSLNLASNKNNKTPHNFDSMTCNKFLVNVIFCQCYYNKNNMLAGYTNSSLYWRGGSSFSGKGPALTLMRGCVCAGEGMEDVFGLDVIFSIRQIGNLIRSHLWEPGVIAGHAVISEVYVRRVGETRQYAVQFCSVVGGLCELPYTCC